MDSFTKTTCDKVAKELEGGELLENVVYRLLRNNFKVTEIEEIFKLINYYPEPDSFQAGKDMYNAKATLDRAFGFDPQ